jgi:hypothetical protein
VGLGLLLFFLFKGEDNMFKIIIIWLLSFSGTRWHQF